MCSALLIFFTSLKHNVVFVCTLQEHLLPCGKRGRFNLLKPTGHVMHQQFNIQ